MNRNKKKVLAAALAVCMLGILSFSTLAWFNASESVTNKFMVASTGNGDPNQSTTDKIFSLDLWEYVGDEATSEDDADITATEKDQDGLTFEDVLPGVVYHKEPVVENTGSYDQYIRVVVTVTKADQWKQILTNCGVTDLGTIFLGHKETVWESHSSAVWEENNTINYVYYLNDKLTPGEMAVFFTGVKFPEKMTQADAALLLDSSTNEVEFDISVRADAIQTEFAAPVANAQAAFEMANWSARTTTP